MHQSCKSCGARYAIPDEKVERAGTRGLRVRCARCRAIMVVTSPTGAFASADLEAPQHALIAQPIDASIDERDDDTQPGLPERRRIRSSRGARGATGLQEGGGASTPPAPALLSTSGVYRPLPGVERSVTGLHVADRGARRLWYAAIRGRSRGPFSEEEMLFLAREGKVRGSTLVWRPGFSEWVRVSSDEAARGLDGLRRAVAARKRHERRAAHRAEEQLGIHRLNLAADARVRHSSEKAPPPLPADAAGELPKGEGGRAALELPTVQAHTRAKHASRWPRRLRMFAAGALLAVLGLVVATYTVPELRGALTDGTVAGSP